MTESNFTIPTIRQYLFLKWLYQRKKNKMKCQLDQTDIECFNCLDTNEFCKKGVIPASFFYKKVQRQYFDCKRVLNSLENHGLISQLNLDGKDYSVFYEITDKGIEYLDNFEMNFWLNHHNSHPK